MRIDPDETFYVNDIIFANNFVKLLKNYKSIFVVW